MLGGLRRGGGRAISEGDGALLRVGKATGTGMKKGYTEACLSAYGLERLWALQLPRMGQEIQCALLMPDGWGAGPAIEGLGKVPGGVGRRRSDDRGTAKYRELYQKDHHLCIAMGVRNIDLV